MDEQVEPRSESSSAARMSQCFCAEGRPGRAYAGASLSVGAPGGAGAVAGAAPPSGERGNSRSVAAASAALPVEIKCVFI